MSLTLQPVRIGTGCDEEGLLVFNGHHRLVGVLAHLSRDNEVAPGQKYLEASFSWLDRGSHPTARRPAPGHRAAAGPCQAAPPALARLNGLRGKYPWKRRAELCVIRAARRVC
jgi:hypothetical protein